MKQIITLISAALMLTACSTESQIISSGIDNSYNVTRLKKLLLAPAYTGDSYRWTMKQSDGADTLLSTEKNYIFVGTTKGHYKILFTIINGSTAFTDSTTVNVYDEEVAYSPYISGIDDYQPAPGQYVNTMPEYSNGDDQNTMNQKCMGAIGNNAGGLITLGSYGGYVTFHFDHTVANVSGKKDFMILGNAYYAPNYDGTGGNAEPGIVEVALDKNMNGIADDDEWYELAGSAYSQSVHNYMITYTRTAKNNITWKDSRDSIGTVQINSYHTQDYYPQWISSDNLSFSGTLLPKNGVNKGTSTSPYYVLFAFDWGYADNHPNSAADKNCFDISWAVDNNGNHISLSGIDFVRVYTAENQVCGWIGETSTEIAGAQDLHP